ncbi:hypothetical protein Tsubulata_006559 [Turnera subulata]|uniref:FAD-binding PCMH-type domain-containing protein n=1 Tax=Turnera subulata TaxID=218843 RepID=A0A9Q0JCS8_9ROSI|nr:hypothetical protein Tsubulata_006559 [Turnera subulata]
MDSSSYKMLSFLAILILSFSSRISADTHEDFLECLTDSFENSNSISRVLYTKTNPSTYASILQSAIRNGRFNTSTTPKPLVIVTPEDRSHIQAVIACSKKHGMQVRVRSGGHDYEGISYVSSIVPYVVIDLVNFRNITVDVPTKTAWVEAGAQLGEVYYRIAEKSRTLAFPAGVCPTVGVGGHFSGGGYGMMLRKHGLAADHIIDAQLIDVEGRILDRKSMGEDLFWAIRGGGGNTFGVVIAWKLSLVQVPATVTAFNVTRTSLEHNVTKLVHRWQYAINKFDEELFSRIFIGTVNSTNGDIGIRTTFTSLFLAGVDRLLPMMQETFPELGLTEQDCIEMSWIESVVFFADFPMNTSLDVLLDRTSQGLVFFKGKSDYVKEPMPEIALEGIWKRLYQVGVQRSQLQFSSYGGRMNEISESSTPFPHRAGTLFQIHYGVSWVEDDAETFKWHINWIRGLYRYMASYVSKNPRGAYINYRDLDLGVNNLKGNTSYRQAKIWGAKYFGRNFDRLVQPTGDHHLALPSANPPASSSFPVASPWQPPTAATTRRLLAAATRRSSHRTQSYRSSPPLSISSS